MRGTRRSRRVVAMALVACALGCVAPVLAQEPSARPAVVPRAGRAAGFSYQETIVGGGRGSDALPLIVALHQLGAGPRGAARIFDTLSCPARVIAPRGPLRFPPGFSFIEAFAADRDDVLAPELRRSAAGLADFIEEVRAHRPTVGTPIVTGFSQGGTLTLALAALHPESVGVAFAGAGTLPRRLWPREGGALPAVVAFHGARDTIVPVAGARAAVAHFRRLGGDATMVVHPDVGHELTPSMKNALRQWVSEAAGARRPCSI